MSDDIQMDLETPQQVMAHAPADPASVAATSFFQWKAPAEFGAPDAHAMGHVAQSGVNPFGQSMPPGVTASVLMDNEEDGTGGMGIAEGVSIPAKMHIRRPGRDNWSYIGRVNIYQELTHKAPVIVIRLQSTNKIAATFTENSNISVDKRGNFIVVAVVEPAGVISYSLHAQTNNDALKLLSSIELATYRLGGITGNENRQQSRTRRKIERTIKEDRRRRHRRRKDDDALVAMLDNANLGNAATVQ